MPEPVPPLFPFPADLQALYPQAELVWGLLEASLTGLALYSPLLDGQGRLVDFRIDLLNPAAQHILQQPARPPETYLHYYPHTLATGVFAFHRDAFESGVPARLNVNYQADGLDNYFQLSARRVGQGLLVSFTDTAHQPRTEVELALRQSQAQEQEARAEAERQRQHLYRVLEQAPAMICLFQGPQHVFEFVNPPYQALVGNRPLVGQSIAEAMPELAGQPIFALLDQVYRTGETFHAHEMLVQLDHANAGLSELEKRYYNFIYQARFDSAGDIEGILVFAYEVTTQVLARQQVQALNEELATSNEELHASNDEYLRTNTDLAQAQQQVQQLNQELEARVQQRTAQLATALQETERQRARVQQQQRQQQQILGQVPAAIATLTGPEHRFTFFNEPYQTLSSGRTHVGRTVAEVFPEVVAQGFIGLLDEVYRSGQPFVGTETPLSLYDPATGQPEGRYVDFIYQPLLDEHDQPTGILAFLLDVTEKVLGRREREAQQQQLQAVFEQAPVAICVFRGPDYVLDVVNPPMVEMLGRPRHQLRGQPFFAAMPELVDQGLRELLDQVRQTSRPFVAQEQELHLDRHGPGKTGFFNFVYQPLLDGQDRIMAITCIAIDVTEQVRARQQVQDLNEELAVINEELAATNEELQATNEELHESNEQLTRTNADLDNFIYTASHDLKQPIANIEALRLALEQELPAAGRVGEVPTMLELMAQAVERFGRTITHLTDVSRLQKEHARASTRVLLGPIVREVQLDLAPLIEQTKAQVRVDIAPGTELTFSEKNLRSVVYNLLSNALKYRHPDRVPQVELVYAVQPGYDVLEVHDNGLGIDLVRDQGKLFAMFERLHTHIEGSGVGLYMIKKMVENAGGNLQVRSRLEWGSTFTVYFPR